MMQGGPPTSGIRPPVTTHSSGLLSQSGLHSSVQAQSSARYLADAADPSPRSDLGEDRKADQELNFLEAGVNMLAGDEDIPRHDYEWDRKAWNDFAHFKHPNVFGNLYIAEDGGFSEVKDLWNPMRWFTATMTIAFIISNVYFIIFVDFNILAGHPASGDVEDMRQQTKMFLLTQPIALVCFGNTEKGDDLLAMFELCGLTVLVAHGIHQLCMAHGAKNERLKWFGLYRFFWQIVPQLSSYSAMRLLHNVSPTVFVAAVYSLIGEIGSYSKWDTVQAWAKFILFRLFCFIVGFDSFLVKIRAAYTSINEQELTFKHLYGALVFMIQVLGVIRLGTFVQSRLFIFIFAGEDGIMQPYEKAKRNVWNALLVRKMWQTYTSWPQFVAMMLSFDDNDFQKLVLNERAHVLYSSSENTEDEAEVVSSASPPSVGRRR